MVKPESLLVKAGLDLPEELHSFIKKGGTNVSAEYLRRGNVALIAIDLDSIEETKVSNKGEGVSWLFNSFGSLADVGGSDKYSKINVAIQGFAVDAKLKADKKAREIKATKKVVKKEG